MEGDTSYRSVMDIPGGVDGVVVVTMPEVSAAVVADCGAAGIPRVWLHRGLGPGSMSDEAVTTCRANGIAVIAGGCPNMFGATSDPGHRCLRLLLQGTHEIPSRV